MIQGYDIAYSRMVDFRSPSISITAIPAPPTCLAKGVKTRLLTAPLSRPSIAQTSSRYTPPMASNHSLREAPTFSRIFPDLSPKITVWARMAQEFSLGAIFCGVSGS